LFLQSGFILSSKILQLIFFPSFGVCLRIELLSVAFYNKQILRKTYILSWSHSGYRNRKLKRWDAGIIYHWLLNAMASLLTWNFLQWKMRESWPLSASYSLKRQSNKYVQTNTELSLINLYLRNYWVESFHYSIT
jgi:hypothetical protein